MERKLGMILSLNENRKPKCLIRKWKFSYKTKELKVNTPERKLQLVWDKI